MAELKTKPNDGSVEDFINSVTHDQMRQDAFALVELMRQATKSEPKMWGSSIIGFGNYSYKYANGRQSEWFLTGFSPRKQNVTLYIMDGFDQYNSLLISLGKHKTGKSCLYIRRLADIDLPTLQKLVQQSVEQMINTNA